MTLRYHLRDTRIGPFPVPKELLDLLLTVLATAVIVILSPDPEQRCPIHGRCVPTRFPCVKSRHKLLITTSLQHPGVLPKTALRSNYRRRLTGTSLF